MSTFIILPIQSENTLIYMVDPVVKAKNYYIFQIVKDIYFLFHT